MSTEDAPASDLLQHLDKTIAALSAMKTEHKMISCEKSGCGRRGSYARIWGYATLICETCLVAWNRLPEQKEREREVARYGRQTSALLAAIGFAKAEHRPLAALSDDLAGIVAAAERLEDELTERAKAWLAEPLPSDTTAPAAAETATP